MATAEELLRPLLPGLGPVPAIQAGICATCHSSAGIGFTSCFQCGREASALGIQLPEVVPITMSIERGIVHRHLRRYKDDPSAEVRERATLRLAALTAVFLSRHSDCLGEWDYATCLPSATRSAVESIALRTRALSGQVETILEVPAGRWSRQFTSERFSVTRPVAGDRVLLIDDTFASGASLLSATAALTSAGADVVGPLVLGRHVVPTWSPSAAMMEWLSDRRWDPDRCCRCDGEIMDPGALF